MQLLKPTSGRVSSQGVATYRLNGINYIPLRDGVNISIIEAKFKKPTVTTYKVSRYDCVAEKETAKRYVTVKTLSQMNLSDTDSFRISDLAFKSREFIRRHNSGPWS